MRQVATGRSHDSFSQLLEDAQAQGLIKIKKDQKSGTYIITGFAQTKDSGEAAEVFSPQRHRGLREFCAGWSKEHIDLFVFASGDSDFSPLVSKLKENDKSVIGVGVKNSTSDLLIDNCDEFIFYEDLVRGMQKVPAVAAKDKKQAECFKLLIDSIKALMRENKEILWGSMVKQTMQRKKPSFNEEYYGYDSFSQLLEDAQTQGLIKIKKDQKSGTYIITGFAQTKDSGEAA